MKLDRLKQPKKFVLVALLVTWSCKSYLPYSGLSEEEVRPKIENLIIWPLTQRQPTANAITKDLFFGELKYIRIADGHNYFIGSIAVDNHRIQNTKPRLNFKNKPFILTPDENNQSSGSTLKFHSKLKFAEHNDLSGLAGFVRTKYLETDLTVLVEMDDGALPNLNIRMLVKGTYRSRRLEQRLLVYSPQTSQPKLNYALTETKQSEAQLSKIDFSYKTDLVTQRAIQASELASGFCFTRKVSPKYGRVSHDSFHGVLGPSRGHPYSCKNVSIQCDAIGSAYASGGQYPAGCNSKASGPDCQVKDLDFVNRNKCHLVAIHPDYGDPSN